MEGLSGKPLPASLAGKFIHKITDLFVAYGLSQRNKDIRLPEISVILRNFKFEYLMMTKGIPRQVRYHSMILMQVVPIVREDQIRAYPLFKTFKETLDLFTPVGKEAFFELFRDNGLLLRVSEKSPCAGQRLTPPLPRRAQYHPRDVAILAGAQETKDRATTTNFDVVGVRPQTQHRQRLVPGTKGVQLEHVEIVSAP